MGKCKGNLLRWGETVFTIEDHRVRDIEHQDRRTRAPILRLVDEEIVVLQLEGQSTTTAEGTVQGARDIEVQSIAELVGLRCRRRLDTRRQLLCLMTPETRMTECREEFTECPVPKEVEGLGSQLELDLVRSCPHVIDPA